MAIRQKAEKLSKNELEVINRGSSAYVPKKRPSRHIITIPTEMLERIDDDRNAHMGFISRNTWILRAIDQYLTQKGI